MTEKEPRHEGHPLPAKKEAAKEGAKPTWEHINSDLKTALDTWSDLTEKLAHELSPEEKQLEEIKSLLGTIKDKLQEFNDK